MKILLITEFFPDYKCKFSGGVETRTFFIAKYLSKKHKVIVISRRKKGEKKQEVYKNLKIIRLGRETKEIEAKFSSIFTRFIFIIQSFIKGLQYQSDLVEGSNFICLLPAFLIAFFKQVPAIAWYPDIYGKEWIKNFGLFTGLAGIILEKIGLMLPWNQVIALSEQTKQKLIKAGINKEKINIIYGGIDIKFIKSIKVNKFKKPTICCISRLVPYKNVDYLIKAVKLIKVTVPTIQCFIIGKGPEETKLKILVKKLNLSKNIIFQKDLEYKKLIEILKSSHLFCLPSRIEGFGLATIEACACNLPFVIADTVINREITQGKGGLFFKTNDSLDLSEKILRLLLNKKFSFSLALKGKSLLKIYDWQKISTQTKKVCQQVLKN